MADGDGVTRRAVAGDADFHGAFRPRAHICRRNRCAPGAVCQYCGGIVFAVHVHGQRGAGGQTVAGTGHDQVLIVFNTVDHIITRHGIDTQTRDVGVDSHITLAGAGVTVAVGHGGGHAQAAVAQRRQHVRRHIH